jgi:tRNA(Ile)-lysidine synthase
MALLALATHAGLRVTAVHVDHGLRAGGDEEAAVVAEAAARFGASFESKKVHVGHGPNLEARARHARYAVLPADALTGHTADDQAETMLLNLMRGGGRTGMAAMRADQRRPLLALRRSETRALCDALGLPVVNDPSNVDPAMLRNRVRHELLPQLCEMAGRDLVPVLTRQAELWRTDDDFLDEQAAALDPRDASALAAAPLALARRAVRRWLTDDHPPDSATVERVLAVARNEAAACDIHGGRTVRRSRQQLRIIGPAGAPETL